CHHRSRFALRLEALGQLPPTWLAADQHPGGLDEDAAQLRVGGADQAGVGLLLSRRTVARRQAAEAGQLLAGAEAVETTDLGPHRPGGHRPQPLDGPQPAHGRVVPGDFFQAALDSADLLDYPREPAQALGQDPAGLLGKLGGVFDPQPPGDGPALVLAALALLAQQGGDGQLEIAALGDELLAVADQGAELAQVLGCDPDTWQVADPFEVGQDA